MKVFVYLVELPTDNWKEKKILSVQERDSSLVNWTTKELDAYFSGEFKWKKIGLYGICALQYINKTKVRFIVKAPTNEMANEMVKSFAWHLDAKKEHKKPYVRRCSGTKLIQVANNLAIKKASFAI